ncbi:hypothetical protein [Maricaulis sp.]|uniref:hypothetical protein n=1 Tax=Maricaulis sp. TaxID=1486257 RepID=UPI0025C43067|nr:hypothetical protein [Maricaulis sp.]
MSIFILAAMLVLQDAEAPPPVEAVAESEPTDAATLIARIEGRLAAYGDTVAQMAARKARERYLSELLLPVIARNDLDDGARGEILNALGAEMRETEDGNNRWALGQIDPQRFAILWQEHPRLGADLLRMAARDPDSTPRLVAALEPVALAGGYDGAQYAAMADALAVTENRPQPYGTATQCVDGTTRAWPVADPEAINDDRAALGLGPFEADTVGGEACETPTAGTE